EILRELAKLRRIGDEVGLGIELDHRADAAVEVQIDLDDALARSAVGALLGARSVLHAQQLLGLGGVAARLLERFLAVHHARAGRPGAAVGVHPEKFVTPRSRPRPRSPPRRVRLLGPAPLRSSTGRRSPPAWAAACGAPAASSARHPRPRRPSRWSRSSLPLPPPLRGAASDAAPHR